MFYMQGLQILMHRKGYALSKTSHVNHLDLLRSEINVEVEKNWRLAYDRKLPDKE